jgi:hypothetical protein
MTIRANSDLQFTHVLKKSVYDNDGSFDNETQSSNMGAVAVFQTVRRGTFIGTIENDN